uniref:Putative secreted protein n=1 Tax=Anopheles darlingi TaxID=43151 RepID=A0A2M4DRP5_ANODA
MHIPSPAGGAGACCVAILVLRLWLAAYYHWRQFKAVANGVTRCAGETNSFLFAEPNRARRSFVGRKWSRGGWGTLMNG